MRLRPRLGGLTTCRASLPVLPRSLHTAPRFAPRTLARRVPASDRENAVSLASQKKVRELGNAWRSRADRIMLSRLATDARRGASPSAWPRQLGPMRGTLPAEEGRAIQRSSCETSRFWQRIARTLDGNWFFLVAQTPPVVNPSVSGTSFCAAAAGQAGPAPCAARRVIAARPPPLSDRAGNNVLDDSIHTRIRGSRVRPHPEPTERRLRRLAHGLMGCPRDPSLVEHMIECKQDRVARLQERRIRRS